MWRWDQAAGDMSRGGVSVGRGYSGAGRGRNNPALQQVANVGPIPRGRWTLTGVRDGADTGPFTIALAVMPGTDAFGRSDFRIHGDSIGHPGAASHGCIIVPRGVRERIWASGDRELMVV